jgi:XTP/dITP diphosphohydrolase
MPVKTLVVGTTNPHKLEEIQAILRDLPFVLRALPPGLPAVDETERTLEGNAALKAVGYARATGELVLAEDTGLEVDALGGAPGVDTAIYAGPKADATQNRRKLLAALRGVPLARRTARFRTIACVASPSGEVLTVAEGRCEGAILEAERGAGGFGYDPLFELDEGSRPAPGAGRSLAELPAAEKNAVSHRARALGALRPKLEELAKTWT